MGCGNSTAGAPAVVIKPKGTPEQQAIAQLKVLFESIDADSNKTLSWNELQMALQKNDKLGALMTEAQINPDTYLRQKLDTNKDGRVTWEEFESQLRTAAIKQVKSTGCVLAAEATVEEKAKARLKELFESLDCNKDDAVSLKELFESLDCNKDDAVSQEELATKLSAEDEGFKTLLVEAGLNTNLEVCEQLGGDSDKRVTWDEFYGKLKAAAKAEVQGTGDVAAATEIIKPEAVRTVRIEDCVTYMCCL